MKSILSRSPEFWTLTTCPEPVEGLTPYSMLYAPCPMPYQIRNLKFIVPSRKRGGSCQILLNKIRIGR
jgi:hypothetical protein